MVEVFTKSQLDAKKVVELRNLAESCGIDVEGMKKPQLIESILDQQEDKVEDIEVVEEIDVNDNDVETPSVTEYDEIAETIELTVEEVVEPKPVIFTKYTKTLTRPQMLYKDSNFTEPISNIIGLIEVIGEQNGKLHVNRVVSGRGVLTGYISK